MADDFYNIKKIYEDYAIGSNQSNYPSGVTYDSKNSYGTSLGGPGNGRPEITGDGAPSSGDLLNMKAPRVIDFEQALSVVEQVVEHEIDQAESEGMDYAVAAIKRIQKIILNVQMHKD